MKKHCLVIAFLAILGCKKEAVELQNVHPLVERVEKLSSRPLASGDPNLDANWDWTQQSWIAYYNNSNGTIGSASTLNPFLNPSQKVFGNVNSQNADMYPSQGWMLVARDFGTPTAANAYPFLVLYNKYRGVLRVCILRTYDVLSSYQQISLSFAPNSSYPNSFKYAADDVTIAPVTNQVAVTTAGVQEWMIADFDVRGYSPNIDNFSAFNINMSEIAQSNIVLNGGISLDGTAQPQIGSPSNLGQVNSIYNFATSTGEGISKVLGKTAAENNFLMSGGANVLWGAFYRLLTGFSGGNATTYNIKLKGKLNLSGPMTLTSPKTSFSVFLKPLPNLVGYKALQDISWGVFNMDQIPAITRHTESFYDWVPNPNGSGDYDQVYTGYMRVVELNPNFVTNANFVINPSIASEVASVEFGFTTVNQDYNVDNATTYFTPFSQRTQFEANPIYLFSMNNWTINLNLKITFNNGVIVYQVIPV